MVRISARAFVAACSMVLSTASERSGPEAVRACHSAEVGWRGDLDCTVDPCRWVAGSSDELNRLAWQAGITLGELQATSADLEHAFFAMTGGTPRGTS